MNRRDNPAQTGVAGLRILRHALIDRVFHWLTAASVLILMATAFLPILGLKFPWVTLHWVTGLILTIAVVFHVIRELSRQHASEIWFGMRDLSEILAALGQLLRIGRSESDKPGKYSPAQKLMHHGVTVLILVTIITGLLMMVKIDTPFWKRDPYWLSSDAWGAIYILHDLAAMSLITVVIIHIYFALRPEKLFYTRSMIKGWITRDDYLREHNPQRWRENNP